MIESFSRWYGRCELYIPEKGLRSDGGGGEGVRLFVGNGREEGGKGEGKIMRGRKEAGS